MTQLNTCVKLPIGGAAETAGLLIVNADDWGRDRETTDRTFECCAHGSVSAVSAMVFMQDSERAAEIARAQGIDVGLHLNFTTRFSQNSCPSPLADRQGDLASYLCRNRYNRAMFSRRLDGDFRYVCQAQIDEFCRVYGRQPERIDGHHHMHLCANVLSTGLLPQGTIARRNFFFHSGEKGVINRLYRRFLDRMIARRHVVSDFLFTLAPCRPLSRLESIVDIARSAAVEVETHPVMREEYELLMSDEFSFLTQEIPVRSFASLRNYRASLHQESDAACVSHNQEL